MYILWTIAQHAEEGAAEPSVFNLSFGVSFWTVAIFLALLWVLSRYAFPPILGYAAAREKRIQDTLDEARRTQEEAERALAEQRKQLAAAREESQKIIADGRQGAERLRDELLSETRAEQEEVIARARQEIEREREKAVEAVRREAVELSLSAAAKLVGERLDAEGDRRIVRRFLEEAGTGGNGSAVRS